MYRDSLYVSPPPPQEGLLRCMQQLQQIGEDGAGGDEAAAGEAGDAGGRGARDSVDGEAGAALLAPASHGARVRCSQLYLLY